MEDGVTTVSVGAKLDRLANAQVFNLRLFEVGVDPDLVDRYHRHQCHTGVDPLAYLYTPFGNEPADWRADLRAVQRDVGIAQITRGHKHLRVCAQRGVIDHGQAHRQGVLGSLKASHSVFQNFLSMADFFPGYGTAGR
ncbi:hypothetical protein D3C78_1028820 [compost metagenome]